MDYRESVLFLDSLSEGKVCLGLENTRRILQYFGNPQDKTPSIHIAGTNGKGSTAAFVASILSSSGYRAGLYTSPHFFDVRERIQIDRKMITEDRFAGLTDVVRKAVELLKTSITYFEFVTVIAFLYFAEEGVDWGVLEVGLGGRLDATNLCNSRLSIITSISLDHQAYLGFDLQRIAFEKASIIREKGMVIADSQEDAVANTIRDMAKNRRAELREFGKDFHAKRNFLGSKNQQMDFESKGRRLEALKIPLIGDHQVRNAGLAIDACGFLGTEENVTDNSVRRGLESTKWLGRLEIVGSFPTILLDGAHNLDSAKKLTIAIKEYFQYRRCIMVIAMMKDKPIEKIATILSSRADHFILTGLEYSRAMDPKALGKIFKQCDKPIEIIEEIAYAVSLAKKMAGPGDLICVTGSLFTVAEARRICIHDEFT